LSRERALPVAVRGPVDFLAFSRLASIFRCEHGRCAEPGAGGVEESEGEEECVREVATTASLG